MRQSCFHPAAIFVLALTFVGCSTIFSAHEAQEAVRAKAEAEVNPVTKLDFRAASLATLVDFALTNRPSIVSARLAVEDARLALREIAADAPILSDSPWTSPKLSLGGNYSESSSGTTLRDHDWKTHGDPSASISLELLVWDFGRYDARAAAQAEKIVAAELALSDEGYTVFSEVTTTYFNYFEKRALLEVSLTNEWQYADHYRRAVEKQKAGEANRLDVLKAKLDLANARQVVVSASNLVQTTGAALMMALGVEAARGTADEVFGTARVGIDCVRRAFDATDYTVDTAFALARTNAPALCGARAKLKAASHAVDYAIADLLPTVSASTTLSWTDPLWYWSWGFSAAQTIFQGFRKTTAVDRAVVTMKTAAAEVDTAEQNLSVKLETAIANRDNSREAVMSAIASVKSAKENLETVREQYAQGAASRVELSDAIASDSQARGDTISAFYDGQRAEAALFAILGRTPRFKEELVKGELK